MDDRWWAEGTGRFVWLVIGYGLGAFALGIAIGWRLL